CSSRKAREMRPDFCASNRGRRPPWTRLCTREEMNTVLPARESPVTPRRSEGEKSPVARPASVSSAIRASSAKVVSDVANICPLGSGSRYRCCRPALKWQEALHVRGCQERFQVAGAGCGIAKATFETNHGEP